MYKNLFFKLYKFITYLNFINSKKTINNFINFLLVIIYIKIIVEKYQT